MFLTNRIGAMAVTDFLLIVFAMGTVMLFSSCSVIEVLNMEAPELGEIVSHPQPCPNQDLLVDIDGNEYKTVLIGDQCWMAENLRVTRYSDGTEIPYVESNDDWAKFRHMNRTEVYGYCFYDSNKNNSYGALYTWTAVTRGECSNRNDSLVQGVCPNGWHIPDKAEWSTLINNSGGYPHAGTFLKSNDSQWPDLSGVTYTNQTGFSALPGGGRNVKEGPFQVGGLYGMYWSSTKYFTNSAWNIVFSYKTDRIVRNISDKGDGFSVRCVKDYNNYHD